MVAGCGWRVPGGARVPAMVLVWVDPCRATDRPASSKRTVAPAAPFTVLLSAAAPPGVDDPFAAADPLAEDAPFAAAALFAALPSSARRALRNRPIAVKLARKAMIVKGIVKMEMVSKTGKLVSGQAIL